MATTTFSKPIDDEIAALNNNIKTEQVLNFATVVNDRSTFNANYNFCYKKGDLVQLDFDITSKATTDNNFLSLISSVRPKKTIWGVCWDLTAAIPNRFSIGTNGDVSIYNFTNQHEYLIHVMYVA